MTAANIVRQVLEADGDEFDPQDIAGNLVGDEFHRGAGYILRQAEDLYKRLDTSNVLSTLRKERAYDSEAIAGAVMLLALERTHSPGIARAHKSIKRLAKYLI